MVVALGRIPLCCQGLRCASAFVPARRPLGGLPQRLQHLPHPSPLAPPPSPLDVPARYHRTPRAPRRRHQMRCRSPCAVAPAAAQPCRIRDAPRANRPSAVADAHVGTRRARTSVVAPRLAGAARSALGRRSTASSAASTCVQLSRPSPRLPGQCRRGCADRYQTPNLPDGRRLQRGAGWISSHEQRRVISGERRSSGW